VVAAILYSGVYAGTVDLAMIQDGRYAVERWLHANAREDALIVTIGRHTYLPRLRDFRTLDLIEGSLDVGKLAPDYVVVNIDYNDRFGPETHVHQQYLRLSGETSAFRQVLDSQSGTLAGGLRFHRRFGDAPANVFTNLAKINPRIVVFELVDRPY
jgi:hypothetical protein